MATKEFVALDGLTRYDQLLKGVMSTEDAKSIKVVTVSNNIVNFYKTETATGTPAYTVTLPTVSDFIHKISSATGGKIVTSTSGGEVAESSTAISDLATKAFVGTLPAGAESTNVIDYIDEAISDAGDNYIPKEVGWTNQHIAITWSDGTIGDSGYFVSDLATASQLNDKIDKITSPNGNKVVLSNSNGTLSESQYGIGVSGSPGLVVGYFTATGSNLGTIPTIHSDDKLGKSAINTSDVATSIAATAGFDDQNTIASALADKINKISSATGGKIVTSTANGEVTESGTAISDLATKTFVGSIPAGSSSTSIVDYISEAISDASDDYIPKGTNWHDDYIAVTKQDGTLAESGYSLARYVIRDELGGYIHKGTNWGGNNVIVSNQNGDISETEYPIGCDNQVGIPVGYFDANNAIVVTNIESGSTDLINSGISITDVESSIAATSGFDGDNTIADAFDELGTAASKDVGVANGVAELDSTGRVPSSQLPSYVDDVVDGYYYNNKFYEDSAHTTEITGQTGKIYIDLVSNKTYRWTGSGYAEISASLALGETSSTAYRGDRGKTAYDHSQLTSGNPHNVTKSDVGLGNVGNFKAVSTVASQGLTSTEQSNARTNVGLGTAAVKDVPASGNASTTQVVMGNDTRVTDEPNLRAAFDALGFSVVNGALCQTYTA